jgi:DNA primase
MPLGNVHLTPQLVQAVRDAVEIVDIASGYTRLTKAGKRYKGLCPLHKEKTPSFSVEPQQGLFYCFGCGQGGDAIRLHQLLSGDDFAATIEALARRYGIPLPTRHVAAQGARREPDLEAVLERAADFFRAELARAAEPRSYLEGRGIAAELAERYGLGYAPPGWRNLLEALRGAVPVAELEAAGLAARPEKGGEPYDRFRHRLLFPIRTAAGRLVGFGGRALDDDPAKYLNTAETERFHKGSLLYGLDQAKRAIRERGRVLLVEGYFDVLGAVATGLEETVASMGTALTADQARLLARYADEVVVGYDGDEAGERAYRRALPLLLGEGVAVRRLRLAAGEDPDSLRLREGPEALARAVAEAPDAVSSEIERLTPGGVGAEPRRQATAAKAVGELLAPIRDSVLRYAYSRQAADRLVLPAEVLWRRVGGEATRLTGGASARPGAAIPAGPGGAATATPAAAGGVAEVRSLEERLLQLFLGGEANLPAPPELPPADAFFQPECRHIYAVFLDLYGEGGVRPEPRAVLGKLAAEPAAVDRMARLLLEDSVGSRSGELRESIRQLRRRWLQQRQRELAAAIADAQRSGDEERLERLIREKTALSLDLHRP